MPQLGGRHASNWHCVLKMRQPQGDSSSLYIGGLLACKSTPRLRVISGGVICRREMAKFAPLTTTCVIHLSCRDGDARGHRDKMDTMLHHADYDLLEIMSLTKYRVQTKFKSSISLIQSLCVVSSHEMCSFVNCVCSFNVCKHHAIAL